MQSFKVFYYNFVMILFEQASFVFLVSSRFNHLEISQTHSKAPSIHPPSLLSQECHLKTIKELDSLFLYLKNIYEIAMLERKKKVWILTVGCKLSNGLVAIQHLHIE